MPGDRELRELLDDEQPLTAEEKAALAAEDDPLASELRGLGDAEIAPSFTAEVMQEVEVREPSAFARVRDAVLRPRLFRINVAMVVPVAVISAVIVAIAVGKWSRREPAPVVVRTERPAPVPSNEPPEGTVIATFELAAPDARTVAVAGDFNGWDVTATPLTDANGDGIWTATVPIEPGRYAYMFVVDGTRWVLDPDAEAVQPDGFGGTNAVLKL